MKKLGIFEWLILLQCFVSIFDGGFYSTQSTKAFAKHVNGRRNLEDNLRLLSYLDNENQIPLETLENLSPAKLIGNNESPQNGQNDDNKLDDISKSLQLDDPMFFDEKSTPSIGI